MKVYVILQQECDSESTSVYAVYRNRERASDVFAAVKVRDDRHYYWIEECEVKE